MSCKNHSPVRFLAISFLFAGGADEVRLGVFLVEILVALLLFGDDSSHFFDFFSLIELIEHLNRVLEVGLFTDQTIKLFEFANNTSLELHAIL